MAQVSTMGFSSLRGTCQSMVTSPCGIMSSTAQSSSIQNSDPKRGTVKASQHHASVTGLRHGVEFRSHSYIRKMSVDVIELIQKHCGNLGQISDYFDLFQQSTCSISSLTWIKQKQQTILRIFYCSNFNFWCHKSCLLVLEGYLQFLHLK